MTFKELKDFLSGIDEDANVYIDIGEHEDRTYDIGAIYYEPDRKVINLRTWL